MNSILTRKSGFVSFVVASASRRIVPVTALIQNATHSIGRTFFSGATGNAGANPRIRRSNDGDEADEDRHAVGVKEENRRKREQ